MGLHTRLFPECNLCFLLYLEPPFLYTVSVNQAASLPVANTRLGLRHRQRKDLGLFFSKAHRGTSWKCLFHLFQRYFRKHISKVCQRHSTSLCKSILVKSCFRQPNREILWKGWKGHRESHVRSTGLKIGAASARNKCAVHFAQLVQRLNVRRRWKYRWFWVSQMLHRRHQKTE